MSARNRWGSVLVAGVVAGAGLVLGTIQAGADQPAYAIHYLGMRGAPKHGGSQSVNLIDHSGPVLASSKTYTVWWGPSGSWAGDVQTGIADLLSGLNGSTYFATAGQYMRSRTLVTSYGDSASDTTSPPNPNRVGAATLGTEVAKEALANSWNVAAGDVFFVYTSNFPKGGNYCAWHSFATVGGVIVSVAYMPNTTGVAGCNPNAPSSITGSEALVSLANVTAHEFMESVTDPQISAWYDTSGYEIGDKCAWQFTGDPVSLGGTNWWLQEEWSNAVSGCVATTAVA